MISNQCNRRQQLVDYLSGFSDEESAKDLEQHLESCSNCEQELEQLEKTPTKSPLPFDRLANLDGIDEFSGQSRIDEVVRQIKRNVPTAPEPGPIRPVQFPENYLLGNYRLEKILGQGGMACVYQASHCKLKKQVAVKILSNGEEPGTESSLHRVEREIESVGKLDHPAIVAATDAGVHEGTVFLVTELIDGLDLKKIVRTTGPLKIEDACEVVYQAALGIAKAHQSGMIHRDIKPSNIMLDKDGQVKILDFGLVRYSNPSSLHLELTTVGQLLGTLDYMAPEQAENANSADQRSDVYSLAASLFCLLTGHAPFVTSPGQTAVEKLRLLATSRPPKLRTVLPKIDPKLAAIVDRCLSSQSKDRVPSAIHFAELLEPFRAGANLEEILKTALDSEPNSAYHDPDIVAAISTSPSNGNRRWGNWWIKLLAASFFGFFLFWSITLIIQTQQGEIIIQSDSANITAKILKDNKHYKTIQIEPGNNRTKLFAGKYEIVLDSKTDSFSLSNNQFQLKRQGIVIATVTQKKPNNGSLPEKTNQISSSNKSQSSSPYSTDTTNKNGSSNRLGIEKKGFDRWIDGKLVMDHLNDLLYHPNKDNRLAAQKQLSNFLMENRYKPRPREIRALRQGEKPKREVDRGRKINAKFQQDFLDLLIQQLEKKPVPSGIDHTAINLLCRGFCFDQNQTDGLQKRFENPGRNKMAFEAMIGGLKKSLSVFSEPDGNLRIQNKTYLQWIDQLVNGPQKESFQSIAPISHFRKLANVNDEAACEVIWKGVLSGQIVVKGNLWPESFFYQALPTVDQSKLQYVQYLNRERDFQFWESVPFQPELILLTKTPSDGPTTISEQVPPTSLMNSSQPFFETYFCLLADSLHSDWASNIHYLQNHLQSRFERVKNKGGFSREFRASISISLLSVYAQHRYINAQQHKKKDFKYQRNSLNTITKILNRPEFTTLETYLKFYLSSGFSPSFQTGCKRRVLASLKTAPYTSYDFANACHFIAIYSKEFNQQDKSELLAILASRLDNVSKSNLNLSPIDLPSFYNRKTIRNRKTLQETHGDKSYIMHLNAHPGIFEALGALESIAPVDPKQSLAILEKFQSYLNSQSLQISNDFKIKGESTTYFYKDGVLRISPDGTREMIALPMNIAKGTKSHYQWLLFKVAQIRQQCKRLLKETKSKTETENSQDTKAQYLKNQIENRVVAGKTVSSHLDTLLYDHFDASRSDATGKLGTAFTLHMQITKPFQLLRSTPFKMETNASCIQSFTFG